MRNKSKANQMPQAGPDGVKRRAYRLREIEAEIGVPVSTLRAKIRRGELNPITAFGTWLISAQDYERLLNTRLRNQ